MSNPFDALDSERVIRHAKMLDAYRDLSAEEILADVNVLVQLATFRTRQERILIEARAGVRAGARHECSEWVREGHCQLCGDAVSR